MEILKNKRLAFGLSCCYTSANYRLHRFRRVHGSAWSTGARSSCGTSTICPWATTRPPSCCLPPSSGNTCITRSATSAPTKPIFAMDFQNDGEFVGGCIAGGRRYFHINANGDMDPCVFIHYSDSNIREKTLLEALQSPMFMAYHDGQPFNDNHAAPLPHAGKPGAFCARSSRRPAHAPRTCSPRRRWIISATSARSTPPAGSPRRTSCGSSLTRKRRSKAFSQQSYFSRSREAGSVCLRPFFYGKEALRLLFQSSSSSFSLFSHLTMLPFLQKRSKIPSQNRSSRTAPSKSAVTVFPSS